MIMFEINARKYLEELEEYIWAGESLGEETITAEQLIYLFNDLLTKEND